MSESCVVRSLSELVAVARNVPLERGNFPGKCCMCGIEGTNLLSVTFRDTFTASEFLHDSPFICPACSYMYESNEYRYANWMCNPNEYCTLDRDQVLSAILAYSGPFPMAIYTTSTYKKQGWIRLMKALNYSPQFLSIAWDASLLHTSITNIRSLVQMVHYLEQQGIKKGFLSNQVPPGLMRKVPGELQLQIARFLNRMRHNLIWQWVVNFYSSKIIIEPCDIEAILRLV